jgi:hypothetical protein
MRSFSPKLPSFDSFSPESPFCKPWPPCYAALKAQNASFERQLVARWNVDWSSHNLNATPTAPLVATGADLEDALLYSHRMWASDVSHAVKAGIIDWSDTAHCSLIATTYHSRRCAGPGLPWSASTFGCAADGTHMWVRPGCGGRFSCGDGTTGCNSYGKSSLVNCSCSVGARPDAAAGQSSSSVEVSPAPGHQSSAWRDRLMRAAGGSRRAAIQSVLDGAVRHGAWQADVWQPLSGWLLGQTGSQTRSVEPLSLAALAHAFANKYVVLMGSSTTRFLADDFLSVTGGARRWRPLVEKLSCGEKGSGCFTCVMCCQHGCPSGPKSGEHFDWVKLNPLTNMTLGFSWKPDMHLDPYDVIAFRERFCVQPPDMLIISKGGHEASFRPYSGSEDAWTQETASRLRRWLSLLRCLPERVPIIWLSYDLPTRSPREAALVRLNEYLMRETLDSGAMGQAAYLADGFALTVAATRSPNTTLHSMDGHHYPRPVMHAELTLILAAWLLHTHF